MSSFLILEEKKYYLSNIGIYIYCHSCFRKEGALQNTLQKRQYKLCIFIKLSVKTSKAENPLL